jgi:hypothetical protein
VGIEPGIKPAVQGSARGRVGVMATTATLRSQRYARLLADHGRGAVVVAQACTGLAMAIERGDEAAIRVLVSEHAQPLRQAQVDTVVLGCTHYPFAREWIEQAMGPGVAIIDTAQAVARRAAHLLRGESRPEVHPVVRPLIRPVVCPGPDPTAPQQGQGPGQMRAPVQGEFWTSGDPAALQAFAGRWLGWTINAQRLTDPAVEPGAAAPVQ